MVLRCYVILRHSGVLHVLCDFDVLWCLYVYFVSCYVLSELLFGVGSVSGYFRLRLLHRLTMFVRVTGVVVCVLIFCCGLTKFVVVIVVDDVENVVVDIENFFVDVKNYVVVDVVFFCICGCCFIC